MRRFVLDLDRREFRNTPFALLGAPRCQALQAAVMDMNAGNEREVHARCPNATIASDRFHVVAKYSKRT